MARIHYLLFFLALSTTSCADMLADILGRGKARKSTNVTFEEIRWLQLEDPNCVVTGTSVPLSSVTAHLWNGSAIQEVSIPLKGIVNSDGSFGSANVEGSILGVEAAQTCTVSSTMDVDCKSVSTGKEGGSGGLKICRSNGKYSRVSIEGMALTAHSLLEESFGFYDALVGRKDGLTKAFILAQLKMRKDYSLPDGRKRTLFESDNAGYLGASDDETHVLFHLYPASTVEFAKSGVNLWEVPFVMRHEFSHHVFDHYTGGGMALHGFTKSVRHGSKPHSILPTGHRRPAGLQLTEDSKSQMALDGINEAFADIYAYFQGDGSSTALNGVSCLTSSRDPGSSLTKGGRVKGLTALAVSTYEGATPAAEASDCYEPVFDGEHDIAVALGYPLAQFIKAANAGGDGKSHSRVLLAWASRIDSLLTTNISPISLDTLVRELILALKTDLAKDVTGACPALKAQITGLPLATAACQ